MVIVQAVGIESAMNHTARNRLEELVPLLKGKPSLSLQFSNVHLVLAKASQTRKSTLAWCRAL